MIGRLAAAFCAAALAGPAGAGEPTPGGVRERFGITYATVEGFRPLHLDLYLPPAAHPAAPSTGLPLVVFIHGGAWLAGDRHVGAPFLEFFTTLATRGYAVASIDYRLSGEARFPAQMADVAAAIAFLRRGADEPADRIDPTRIVAWGESAGGLLAALAGTGCASRARAREGCIEGAVAWYGVFDMTTIADQARVAHAGSRDLATAPEWRLLGCVGPACHPDLLRSASPALSVGPSTPPMLLVTGDGDRVVPFQQSVEMAARLEAAGIVRELVVMPGLDHNLAGRTADESRAANLRAFAATLRFIERTIGPESRRERRGPMP